MKAEFLNKAKENFKAAKNCFHKSFYTERPISKKVASRQLGKAKEFVETIERGLLKS